MCFVILFFFRKNLIVIQQYSLCWLFQLCRKPTKPLDDVSAKERLYLFCCWCSHCLVLLNHRFTIMWTVMSTTVCHRKFYSFLFSEYPCSALISYQEVLQIVAISTYWPLSFPVAWFRLCYLIGKHLKSTAGGGRGGIKMWPTLCTDLLEPILWCLNFNKFYWAVI